MIKSLFKNIVVAYNGSKASLHAVMYGIMMAKIYKCQLKVVYVVDTDSITRLVRSKFLVSDEGKGFVAELEGSAERDLNYVVQLGKSKGIKIDTDVRHGAVWAEVIKSAEEYKANLILLGDANRMDSYSTLTHGVSSSQDSEIIGSADCSVMVVRQENIEQMFKLL